MYGTTTPCDSRFTVRIMARSSIRSSVAAKVCFAVRALCDAGPAGALRKIVSYLRFHLNEKWHFVYLQFPLATSVPTVPPNPALAVRVATRADLSRIHDELFPEMQGEQIYDKRYFDRLGDDGVVCFIAERDGRLIHYSWVFFDLHVSPLAGAPVDRSCIREGDVFVGPVFTIPTARGFVYPHVLSTIIRYLQAQPMARRIVIFVYEKNPGAVAFHKRMGFTEMENAQMRSAWRDMLMKPLLFGKVRKE